MQKLVMVGVTNPKTKIYSQLYFCQVVEKEVVDFSVYVSTPIFEQFISLT
jgi:hypothetical protein